MEKAREPAVLARTEPGDGSTVVLVGQKKALAMAARGSRTVRRWSKLGEWLAAASPVVDMTK